MWYSVVWYSEGFDVKQLGIGDAVMQLSIVRCVVFCDKQCCVRWCGVLWCSDEFGVMQLW